jgi:hypothetical protein
MLLWTCSSHFKFGGEHSEAGLSGSGCFLPRAEPALFTVRIILASLWSLG